jgi:hypothetical protein
MDNVQICDSYTDSSYLLNIVFKNVRGQSVYTYILAQIIKQVSNLKYKID